MADESKATRNLRLPVVFSGVLAITQSILWIILTITQIILSSECPELPEDPKLLYFFRIQYLSSCKLPDTQLLKPEDLLIWNCIILALTVLWLLSSILMLGGVKKGTLKRQSTIYLLVWSSITFCVCLVDLGLGAFFANDLSTLSDMKGPDMIFSIVSGIMMTIAFKGYALWIINFACAIYLAVCASKLADDDDDAIQEDQSATSRPPIYAFEQNLEQRSSNWLADAGTLDRPRIQNSYPRLQGEDNRGFVSPMDNSKYQQQQPLASIMKKSVADKKMQRNKEPHTPSPDYSPPAMRSQRQQPFRQNSDNSNYYSNPYKR